MRTDAQRAPLADINVTPLVDVMLVLLIIFMVTAPLLRQGFNVTLPRAATGKAVPSTELVMTLTKDHMVYLNDEVVTLNELRQKLAHFTGDRPVFIRADRHAYVNNLIQLWDLCREMGVRDIHVATLTE